MTDNKAGTFHIQHKARLEHILRILETAAEDEEIGAKDLHLALTQAGYEITLDGVTRSLNLAQKLEIVNKSTSSRSVAYILTPRGHACRSLALYRREVFWDVMHFLLYSSWELGNHRDYWSWSYARICEILWLSCPKVCDRSKIFGELSAAANKDFPNLSPVVGTETVQFVTSCLKWLSPPFLVVEDDRISASQTRQWFSVELALLAISYLYAARRAVIGTPILLDREALQQLEPLCFASSDCIALMLEVACRTFPFVTIHVGEWGSSVILKEAIDIPALV